jgi:methionyl-tRNA formyltransferase
VGEPTPAGAGSVPGALDGPTVMTGSESRIRLIRVQPEGKRPLEVQDWLRGVRPEPHERLGV